MGTAHPNLVPYQVFATQDGHVMIAIGNNRQFAACMECLGRPELGLHEDFSTNAARIANRDTLIGIMHECLQHQTTAHWIAALTERGIPAGPINDIGEVLSNDYAIEKQIVRHLENGAGDAVPTVANPVDFRETPVRYERAPPLLGEHTNEVLREWLGYSDELIAALRKDAAI